MAQVYTKFAAIYSLVGGKLFANGDDVKYIDGQTPPTDKEIDTEIKRLEEQDKATEYQKNRIYPDLGEQLDLLFHDMTAGKGDKTGEWYKAVAKVKADHPKP